jgi:uncharacterized protein (DUF362 family)
MKASEKTLTRRGGENKIIGKSGKPLLVIVEGSDIKSMIKKGLDAIGGIKSVIGNLNDVVIKPNTNQRDPYPSITAPEAIAAVVNLCREAGAKHILVHEDHKFEKDPYYTEKEIPFSDIVISDSSDSSHFVPVEFKQWRGDVSAEEALKGNSEAGFFENSLRSNFTCTEGPCLRVNKYLQEAKVIINMPVVKRHFAGQFSSALKNHFGSVYGPHRWLAHAMLTKDRDYYDRKLAEFASAIRPELTIVDARSMQAVFGPFRTEETKIIDGLNKIILSGDMIAADVIVQDLIKKFDKTYTSASEEIVRRQWQLAEELGVGSSDLSKFEVIELKI